MAAIRARLRSPRVRLLTLVGPPGVGKTRLALEMAWQLSDDFAHGAYFVELASVVEAPVVASAIVEAIGVKLDAAGDAAASLCEFVSDKHILLVLDNFEQLLPAASLIGELLAATPALKILVTSRRPLRIYGEHEFPLSPLELPDLADLPPLERLARIPAVALFLERAQAVRPDFALTSGNALAVAASCVRLDGLPLAIELGAARIRHLEPSELAAQLVNRLAAVRPGPRNVQARQQTLRAAIEWSYRLLGPEEQRVFRQLGVFVDGFTLEAAEVVLGDRLKVEGWLQGVPSARDGLASLVDHSLVQRLDARGGRARFTMLETVREFALEQLAASGEEADVRGRHAHYFCELAEAAYQHYSTSAQPEWQARLAVERPNLRAAVNWAAAYAPSTGLRMAAALWLYWNGWGHYQEAIAWLERFLSLVGETESSKGTRSKALLGIGWLAHRRGDELKARRSLEEGLALLRELGDTRELALGTQRLAEHYRYAGDLDTSETLAAEALRLFRGDGFQVGISWSLSALADVACRKGRAGRAQELIDESISAARTAGEPRHLAWMLALGCAIYRVGQNHPRARACATEAHTHMALLEDQPGMAWIAIELGRMASAEADLARAESSFREALALTRESGTYITLTISLLGLVALERRAYRRGVRLSATALAHSPHLRTRLYPSDLHQWERALDQARAALGEPAYARAWEEGQALPLDPLVEDLLR